MSTDERRSYLEALFRAHARSVWAYARRRSDPATADDAVGDVFVVAWRHLDAIPDDALPWLLACARHALANAQRADRRRTRLFQRVAAGAVIAAVSVALGIGLSGSGPQNAFAGWTARPTQPANGQLPAAQVDCGQSRPELAALSPTVIDTRGPTSLLVYVESDRNTVCASGAPAFGTAIGVSGGGNLSAAPAAGTITPHQLQLMDAADGQGFGTLDGQVGAGVTAVTLVLDDGTSVQATVANGWFAAWWPENRGVQSAQITTATGTTTQTINGYSGSATPPLGATNGPTS